MLPGKKFVGHSEGGLGLRRTQDINVAKMSKLGWKILTEPDNILVKSLGVHI